MVVAPEWWLSGKQRSLSPWAQAQVFAWTRVSERKKFGLSLNDIAAEVTKVCGGGGRGLDLDLGYES